VIVLVVVPAYASHWYPLSAIADALRRRGHGVIVATGRALGPLVAAAGHRHVDLTLGPGSNAGVRRSGTQTEIDDFLTATLGGMIATLRHQAERRRHDLLWEPEAVAERIRRIHTAAAPDVVLVDHLAFNATAALRGLRLPFVSFLPGHPCQLTGPGEIFGYPELRPSGLATEEALRSLRTLCSDVSLGFTAAYNAATSALDPTALPLADAFAAGGTLGTLVNYPAQLGTHASRLPQAQFLGSCIREEEPDLCFERLADVGRFRPRVYVSLGTFLSARADVMQRIASAVRALGWDAVIARGGAPARALGTPPAGWVVEEHLPQVAALRACDVVVCHGGNNTVTEALTAGLPVLAAPFSTDQFAGAEDLRRAGLGDVIDPTLATHDEIAARLRSLLDGDAPRRAAALGRELRRNPGPELAADILEAGAAASALAA
jgi:zeaxanthin glucosyltransferase